jgi:predicted SAM-dependent methyltransferase
MIKLHIGAGHAPKKGYINIDARKVKGIDVVAKAHSLPYKDGEVDLIESYHMIEHYGRESRVKLIEEWYRILKKPEGKLIIELPDSSYYMKKAIEKDLCLDMPEIFGLERNQYDVHRWGYSRKSIVEFLQENKFTVTMIGEGTDYHSQRYECIRVEATK